MPPPRRTPANDAAIGGTQRQPAQTLESPVSSASARTAVNSPPVAPPPAPISGHRPSAPLPITSTVPLYDSAAPTLEQLVRKAHEQGISDIHLGVGEVPRFRERGQIITTDYPETDEATFSTLR